MLKFQPLKHRSLFQTTALITLLAFNTPAHAGPDNGVVTGGSASIQNSGNNTTINQTSNRAIIRWDKFDLNNAESVQFNQPNTGSITVNRIRDTKASRIDGHIGANGNIILINPNGLVFGSTATVDVGGLVATTSDLEDDNAFMQGGAVKLTKPGVGDASVINHGTITVKDGGLVGLVAPNVENSHVIQARLGKVALASGDIATIDFAGDGLIKLEVSDQVLSQSVKNSGTITADGGEILLTAAQARGLVDALITNTGTLQANTITVNGVQKTGRVLISTKGIDVPGQGFNLTLPRGGGAVFNTGRIEANGNDVGEMGGIITILSDKVNIGDGSYVTASGDTNGGSIRIGGGYQGGQGLPTSEEVFVSDMAVLNASSRRRGQGGNIILWSDEHTWFLGHADVSGGVEGGDGGFIEVSGKDKLDFTGTVNLSSVGGKRGVLLLDPTDIVISSAANSNVSGSSPFAPNIDDGPSVLNVTTLQNALASGDVIVQTRATGSQAGNITVSNAITWGSASTLTLDAHNNIIVNAAISGQNIHFVVGNDITLAAAVSGSGNFIVEQASDATTIGIGASAVGTLNFSTTDLSNITNGWSNIIIGKSSGTGAIDMRAVTWNDDLTIKSGTGVITATGTQTMGANNLTMITDGDIVLTGSLTGTGTLTITQTSAGTGIGLGNAQTGAVNLNATEVGKITNGWASLVFGRTDGTGAINMGALTWNDNLTLQSGSGVISVVGVQTMGANTLNIVTDGDISLGIANALTGTGALSISQSSAATTIGLGDTQTGTINLTTTEVSYIKNGWASLVFGRTDGTGAINIGALTWNDVLTVQSDTGAININGIQTMGANNLTFRTNGDIGVSAALTGTGTLTVVQSSASASIGIGTGQAGDISFTDAELAQITNGWASLVFGRSDSTGGINVGAETWTDPLTLQSGTGVISINGATAMGNNALTIRTDADIVLNAGLSGAGTSSNLLITQSSAGTSMALGTGETGTVNLDATELAYIVNGWNGLTFGRVDGTGTMNVGAATWNDSTVIRTGSGQLSINGVQNANANTLSLLSNGNIAINANLTGAGGSLVLATANNATAIGIGTGQTGAYIVDDTELARIVNGWANIYVGTTTHTAAINIGAATWNDSLTLRSSTGVITVNGTQNALTNNITISTDTSFVLNNALTGSGTLTIQGSAVGTSIGVGTGQTGSVVITDTQVSKFTDGWTNIIIGTTSMTGAMNIGALTWVDPLTYRVSTGIITVNGDQNMGANALTLTAGSNTVLNANLIGTGTLSLTGVANGTTIGIGTGQAGTHSYTDAELARIIDGWGTIVIGSTGMTGALNVGARTWYDNVDMRTNTGALNLNGVQTMGANNLTIRTNTDLALTNALTGTGTLNIWGSAATTTMGIGTGQTGTLVLTDTELGQITDGWGSIVLGSTSMTAVMNVGARTWTDNLDLRTKGVITINGAQAMGANNLTIRSDANPVIGAALGGTGTLTLLPITATTTIGVGTGQAGTFGFTDAELDFITNGWNSIIIGSNAVTGAMAVGARTWNDNLTLRTAGGVITVAGAQTMGSNNLTILTDGNLALNANLSGSGTLTIAGSAVATTVGIGTGQTGTLSVIDTELAKIVDGWGSVVLGLSNGTGAMNVGAYTWSDNLTLLTGSGLMTIAGAQTMGANNLTISTDSNLALNANLSGSGALTIKSSALATTIGVGDLQTGTLALANTELAKIVNGWASVTIGSTGGLGVMNIGAYTWLDKMTFVTQGNVIINGAQNTTETSGTTLTYATTNGAFINNVGASAINPGTGRFLIYSVASANDTINGLVPGSTLTNKTYVGYGPSSVVETGNIFLYSGVASKILYLEIDDATKAYGDNLPTFTYTYLGGLQNGDLITDAIVGVSYTAVGSLVTDNAGTTRTITANFTTGLGYSTVVTNGTLTVSKAVLTVEADDDTRVYGTANPVFTSTYSGFKNGDDITDIDTLETITSAATLTSNVGNYAITASGAVDNNYTFNYVDGTLSITKAMLTATVQSSTRQYGDADPTFGIVYTGFKNGETSAVIDTLAHGVTAATATSNVGSYSVTGAGGVDNNYDFSYVGNTMTITKAALVATADNISRAYGDTNPALTITYSGFKNGETSAVIDTLASASTAATTASNVGTYTITASGAVDNNYSITYNTGTLTVNKAVLTATASSASREYGDANPALTVSYSGFKNSETSAVIDTLATASSAANATSNVGSYATVASGAVDNNYSFSYVDGTLSVTKATLTATASSASREYGDANPALTVSYTGFKNSETSAVIDTLATASSAANATSDVGAYLTEASGAVDGNYDFVYVDGILTITKAVLTVTADDGSREYGDSNPSLGVSYSGFKNGETSAVIDTLATASSAANATSNVGSYATTASGASDNNYSFVYTNGVLSVTQATLTATAENKTRVYGDANPSLTVSYTGFKNGETSAVIDTLATASTAANATSNVGSYVIGVSGASDNNYTFVYNDGALSVTKATLTATAGNATREYGDTNPTINVTYSGFKNGETSAVIDTLAVASSAATGTSNVGTYATTASGASDNNYNFVYANGSMTITKATLTVTTGNATRVYGNTNPSFTVNYSGFKNGETSSVINTQATATSAGAGVDVGSYAITASGAFDNNYNFTYANGGTMSVTKATLTVTADDATRLAGTVNPAFTVSYSGFKNGDTASVIDTQAVATTTANMASPLGTYAITASGASDNNYNFAYVDGTLNVLASLYVPPPPVNPQTLIPTTVQSVVANPVTSVPSNIVILPPSTPVSTQLLAPQNPVVTIISDDEGSFSEVWHQSHYLIAMTDLIRNYYDFSDNINFIGNAEDNRKTATSF